MKTVAEYRQFAEDCRKLAASLTIPADKQALEWLSLGTKWPPREKQVSKRARQSNPYRPPESVGRFFDCRRNWVIWLGV
jgi:hypothetical protein